jgi:hypothetical protein
VRRYVAEERTIDQRPGPRQKLYRPAERLSAARHDHAKGEMPQAFAYLRLSKFQAFALLVHPLALISGCVAGN